MGGNSTYKFLTLPNAARVAALGGNSITLKEDDLNLVFHNPSLLSTEMDNNLVINYVNYLADVNFGYVSYAINFRKAGMFAAGLHYINYGTFTEADEYGEILGEFTAAEYALNLFWSRPIIDTILTVGVNLKPILSNLETYTSFGLATDIGITYFNIKRSFTAAFVIKNLGSQIKPYVQGNYEPLPLDVQLGISKRLAHAPFRISLLAHNLHTIDLTYDDEDDDDDSSSSYYDDDDSQSDIEIFANKVALHMLVGIELLLTKNFHVDFGYNHQRRKELSLETTAGMTGFSWGFGLKISKFHISYGRATYHVAGASNHFSLTTNFNEYKRLSRHVNNNATSFLY